MNSLGDRIRYMRNLAELTQQQLSDRSGVKQSDISKLERGDMKSSTRVVPLAQALHCNPYWLDSGKGDPFTPPGWPWTMFNRSEFESLDEEYRRRIENDMFAEIARQKKDRKPNGTNGG